MKTWGLVMRAQEGGPRRNVSSTKQNKGQKVWSVIQNNVPRDSIDKDTHHGSTSQRGTMKYLRKSCYHRIKCFIANSLVTLMWKWYLNSNFQPYSYSQILQEGADWTEINARNLVYTSMVKMKEWRQYKRKNTLRMGIEKSREKHCKNKN